MLPNNPDEKAKLYWRRKITAAVLNLSALILFLFIIQSSGASLVLRKSVEALSGNFYGSLALYILGLSAFYYLVSLPLDLYSGYLLEHEFGLSNQRLMDWIKDDLKKGALSLAVSLAILEMVYFIARNFPLWWWLISAALLIVLSVVFAMVFPIYVIPLFYKYKALGDASLRAKVLELAKKFGIKVMEVFEIDFSKNTKKSNAALVGWGATRRVILTDNLIREFTPEEVEVVVAHEMAHYKLRHIWKLLALGVFFTTIGLYLFNMAARPILALTGLNDPLDLAVFPAIYLFFIIADLMAAPIRNNISRHFEKDADLLAIEMTALRPQFVSLMEKLAKTNLSDRRPNRILEFILYGHPSIDRRIAFAKAIPRENFFVQLTHKELLEWTGLIIYLKMNCEIYVDAELIDLLNHSELGRIKSRLDEKGISRRLHAPLHNPYKEGFEIFLESYRKSSRAARSLGANAIVMHAEYDHKKSRVVEEWLAVNVEIWKEIAHLAEEDGITVLIENHYESSIEPIVRLLEEVASPNLKACIDVGHLNAFGKKDLISYLDDYPKDLVGEIHLSDNLKDQDAHLPLGAGTVDFKGLFNALDERGMAPAFTLEAKNLMGIVRGIFYLKMISRL